MAVENGVETATAAMALRAEYSGIEIKDYTTIIRVATSYNLCRFGKGSMSYMVASSLWL